MNTNQNIFKADYNLSSKDQIFYHYLADQFYQLQNLTGLVLLTATSPAKATNSDGPASSTLAP